MLCSMRVSVRSTSSMPSLVANRSVGVRLSNRARGLDSQCVAFCSSPNTATACAMPGTRRARGSTEVISRFYSTSVIVASRASGSVSTCSTDRQPERIPPPSLGLPIEPSAHAAQAHGCDQGRDNLAAEWADGLLFLAERTNGAERAERPPVASASLPLTDGGDALRYPSGPLKTKAIARAVHPASAVAVLISFQAWEIVRSDPHAGPLIISKPSSAIAV